MFFHILFVHFFIMKCLYQWWCKCVTEIFKFFKINHFININEKIAKFQNALIYYKILIICHVFFYFYMFYFQFFLFNQSLFHFLCCYFDDECVNKKHYNTYIINDFHRILTNSALTRLLSVINKKKKSNSWLFWQTKGS